MRLGDHFHEPHDPNDNHRFVLGVAIGITLLSMSVLVSKCSAQETGSVRDSVVPQDQTAHSTVDAAPDF